jgi:RNA 2',3'-cyclic 3'-phosphodiesterase
MAHTTRTFVAVPIPANLAEKLARLQGLLAAEVPGVRWVDRSQFHVTLAFLGDVPDADLNAVCTAVSNAAVGFEPLELRLEGLGVFPNPTKPGVLWVGLTGTGLDALAALQREVAEAVRRTGYPPDDRFHPHATLGRPKSGRGPTRDLTPLLNHYRTWAAGSFTASECITFASTLTPDGPVYAPLGRAPLEGRKTGRDG